MSRICQSCHARIDDGMKICANCGRVVPPLKNKADVNNQSFEAQPCMASVSKRRAGSEKPSENRKNAKRSKSRLILKMLKAAIVLLAVYVVLFAAQVFRIKHSAYDFTVDMKMSQSNYGSAFDSYFEDGKWSYNPFTFTAVYSGTHNKENYVITFKALFSVNVTSIVIDGREVKESGFETEIMGMFI